MFCTEQVPPVETTAYGFVRFFFNEAGTAADYTVDVKGVSNNLVLGADIHRGAPGENGPVVKHLADGDFIVTSGRLTLTPDELQKMANGSWYVSLKTVHHPEGEMRGQIMLPPDLLPAAPLLTDVATPVGAIRVRPPNTGDAGLR